MKIFSAFRISNLIFPSIYIVMAQSVDTTFWSKKRFRKLGSSLVSCKLLLQANLEEHDEADLYFNFLIDFIAILMVKKGTSHSVIVDWRPRNFCEKKTNIKSCFYSVGNSGWFYRQTETQTWTYYLLHKDKDKDKDFLKLTKNGYRYLKINFNRYRVHVRPTEYGFPVYDVLIFWRV